MQLLATTTGVVTSTGVMRTERHEHTSVAFLDGAGPNNGASSVAQT
jgi:hypothetical protein